MRTFHSFPKLYKRPSIYAVPRLHYFNCRLQRYVKSVQLNKTNHTDMKTFKKVKSRSWSFRSPIPLPSESHIPPDKKKKKSFQLKIKAKKCKHSALSFTAPQTPKIFQNQRTLKKNKVCFVLPAQQASPPFGLILSGPRLQTAVGDSLQGRQADESFSLCNNRASFTCKLPPLGQTCVL